MENKSLKRPGKNINSVGGIKVSMGDRFGRLVVIGRAKEPHKTIHYLCRCDCGKEKDVSGAGLLSGTTKSCGCYNYDVLMSRSVTHGRSKTRAYRIWAAMKQRCYYEKNKEFENYGGRGITVCERWYNSFENFINDMGEPPSAKHSIDRIDVNGNYEPSNCRWALPKEQMRNLRKNRMIEYKGEMKSIAEVAELAGMNYRTLYYRIFAYGWSPQKAYSTPVMESHRRKTNPWKKI